VRARPPGDVIQALGEYRQAAHVLEALTRELGGDDEANGQIHRWSASLLARADVLSHHAVPAPPPSAVLPLPGPLAAHVAQLEAEELRVQNELQRVQRELAVARSQVRGVL
jgi:hypothetical protein